MKLLIGIILSLTVVCKSNAQLPRFQAVPYNDNFYEKEMPNDYYARVELIPIGWSKDGKFAYIYYFPEWGFHGAETVMPEVHIIIQDMQTDQKLWDWMYSEDEDKSLENYIIPKKEEKEVLKALKKYKIFPKKQMNFVAGASYHDIDFNIYGNDQNIVKIKAKRKYIGTKTILRTSQKSLSLDFGFAGGEGRIAGLIRSPYEDRVAVIYYKTDNLGHREFMTHYRLIGCHLDQGFK